MTFYTLVVSEGHEVSKGRREEILAWLEYVERSRNELKDFHESGMNGYTKWYEHDQAMLHLSRTFLEDLWKCYYFGGRVQEAPACVEYPPFDPDEIVNQEAARKM